TAASFFDLVSQRWLERFLAFLAHRPVPFLAVLNVDGRREWHPRLDDDALVAAAFAAHQRREKGFGAALGPAAPALMAAKLRDAGFRVDCAASDWRLGMRDEPLLAALIDGEAGAAREAAPEASLRIDAWQGHRRALLAERSLTLAIGHCDLLA